MVYQDVIIGPLLAQVVRRYAGLRLAVVVLCPRPEVLAAREAARPGKAEIGDGTLATALPLCYDSATAPYHRERPT